MSRDHVEQVFGPAIAHILTIKRFRIFRRRSRPVADRLVGQRDGRLFALLNGMPYGVDVWARRWRTRRSHQAPILTRPRCWRRRSQTMAMHARRRELLTRGTWNEADHRACPQADRTADSLGSAVAAASKPSSRQEQEAAKKEDFDKAKIKLDLLSKRSRTSSKIGTRRLAKTRRVKKHSERLTASGITGGHPDQDRRQSATARANIGASPASISTTRPPKPFFEPDAQRRHRQKCWQAMSRPTSSSASRTSGSRQHRRQRLCVGHYYIPTSAWNCCAAAGRATGGSAPGSPPRRRHRGRRVEHAVGRRAVRRARPLDARYATNSSRAKRAGARRRAKNDAKARWPIG